jgi:putative ABC transport system permease protein
MPMLSRMTSFLRNILGKRRNERDLDDEVHGYAEMLAEEKMRQGMKPEEARRTARIELGGVEQVKEQVREVRAGAWLDSLLQDLRYGARILRKNPGFTAIAVLTLALGIGANTAMFSVIDAVLIRPLPYKNPARLVMVWESEAGDNAPDPPTFLIVQRQNHVFEYMAASRVSGFNLTGSERPERIAGADVTPNFFPLMGVNPLLGRTFSAEDANGSSGRPAVLSYALWRRMFAGNPDAIGRHLTLDGEVYTVAGIMPANFQYPDEVEAWVLSPFAVPRDVLKPTEDPSQEEGHHYFETIARLKPGVTLQQAKADLDVIAKQIQTKDSEPALRSGIVLDTLQDDRVGDVRPALLVLFGAVGLVLLIACANVANLFLARGLKRQREMSLRIALGASRHRIFQQLIIEGLLLVACGGLLGFGLALAGFAPLVSLMPPDMRDLVHLQIDSRILIFTILASVATGILFGLAPAFGSMARNLNDALKEGARNSSEDRGNNRLRQLLVVSEISLALVLLVGAGLLIRSYSRLQSVEQGFNPHNVLTAQIALPQAAYPDSAQRVAFMDNLLSRLKNLPGVSFAAADTRLPMNSGGSSRSIVAEGRARKEEDDSADYSVVTPDFFSTLQIPLLAGRVLADSDSQTSPTVAVINQSMARYYWPGQNPIGKRFQRDDATTWMEVIGVVRDVHQHSLGDKPRPAFFVPYPQDPWASITIIVRTVSAPESLISAVQQTVTSIDSNQPLYRVRTLDTIVFLSVAAKRFNMLLLETFAGIALLLAAIGIYGVISYSVAQRTSEIGIRMALGAQRSDVLRLVIGQGLRLAGFGIVIGIAAAFALTRLMASLLFGVGAYDPVAFATAAAILLLVAVAACYIPARRAIAVDPMVALRYE